MPKASWGIILQRARLLGTNVLYQFGNITVHARSVAGIYTTLAFPQWSLNVDMGKCTSMALRQNTIAFTHMHADHISGLIQYLGVRMLYNMGPCRIIVPQSEQPETQSMLNSLARLQGRPYPCLVEGAKPQQDIFLQGDLFLCPFAVQHTIPALGYTVLRKTSKLRKEFHALPATSIRDLRKSSPELLFDNVYTPLASITGDALASSIPFHDPMLAKALVLFIDCTFLDEQRTVEHAHLGGHPHLEELLIWLPKLQCEHIVLYHISQIYRPETLKDILQKTLGNALGSRIHYIYTPPQESL